MKKEIRKSLILHLISDSTGVTLRAVSSAAAAQFTELNYQEKTYPMVRTITQLNRVLETIRIDKGVVFCTLVEEKVREKLEKFCKKENIPYFPVMENIVSLLEKYTGIKAINKPGGQHILNDDYFKRIEAINYTLEHDDGQGQINLEEADVIVVGVSRTCLLYTSPSPRD